MMKPAMMYQWLLYVSVIYIGRNNGCAHNKQTNHQLFGLHLGIVPMFNAVINRNGINDEDNNPYKFFTFTQCHENGVYPTDKI